MTAQRVYDGSDPAAFIVIVEDEPDAASMLRDCLEADGYDVEWCEDSSRAAGLVVETQPELVIVDLNLRRGDGVPVIRAMRLDHRTARTPILVCSGDKLRVDQLASELATLDCAVLMKPFDIAALSATVRDLLT